MNFKTLVIREKLSRVSYRYRSGCGVHSLTNSQMHLPINYYTGLLTILVRNAIVIVNLNFNSF